MPCQSWEIVRLGLKNEHNKPHGFKTKQDELGIVSWSFMSFHGPDNKVCQQASQTSNGKDSCQWIWGSNGFFVSHQRWGQAHHHNMHRRNAVNQHLKRVQRTWYTWLTLLILEVQRSQVRKKGSARCETADGSQNWLIRWDIHDILAV